jgi:ribonucleoside-diphosphate reductase alpha chain
MRERSVGLGVMGFHSFLQAHNVPIESVMAKVWNKKIFK